MNWGFYIFCHFERAEKSHELIDFSHYLLGFEMMELKYHENCGGPRGFTSLQCASGI